MGRMGTVASNDGATALKADWCWRACASRFRPLAAGLEAAGVAVLLERCRAMAGFEAAVLLEPCRAMAGPPAEAAGLGTTRCTGMAGTPIGDACWPA